ncbi:MAG: type II secretion system F family protein [Candidatus Hydrogenedentes bacterium]|nr:type II secretion system F family protein [Candidatus Hydrogenedentota bacterium]
MTQPTYVFTVTLLNVKHCVILCRHLLHTYAAGISLPRSFDSLAAEGSSLRLRRVAREVAGLLEQGHTLGGALQRCGRVFPDFFTSMMAIGEQTGTLHDVLEGLTEYYEEMLALRRTFLQQITYPLAVVAAILFGIPLLRLFWLGASAETMFKQVLLPAIIMTASVLILIAVMRGVPPLRKALRLAGLHLWPASWILKRMSVARFAWAMHLTLSIGFLPHRALGFAAHAAQAHPLARRRLLQVAPSVQEGESLYEALAKSKFFSAQDLTYIRTGEESGRLPEAFRRLGKDHYAAGVNTARNFLAVLEGMLILAIGTLVVLGHL